MGAFLGPFESLPLVDQEVEWSTFICRSRNESIQGDDHLSELLDFFSISRRFQVIDGFDLVRVDLDSPMCNHVAQKLA